MAVEALGWLAASFLAVLVAGWIVQGLCAAMDRCKTWRWSVVGSFLLLVAVAAASVVGRWPAWF